MPRSSRRSRGLIRGDEATATHGPFALSVVREANGVETPCDFGDRAPVACTQALYLASASVTAFVSSASLTGLVTKARAPWRMPQTRSVSWSLVVTRITGMWAV